MDSIPFDQFITKTFILAAGTPTLVDVEIPISMRRYIFKMTIHDDANGANVIQIDQEAPTFVGPMPSPPSLDTVATLANSGLFVREADWHSPFYILFEGQQLYMEASANAHVSITYYDVEQNP